LGDYKPLTQRQGDPHLEAGHWEGDLLVGRRNFTVAVVLVERRSRLTLLGACPQGRNAHHVAAVVSRLLSTVPPELRRSLTWDQGTELARWADIETRTGTKVYFAQPRSPWQRPLAENTCGLLRRWLPRNQPMPRHQATLNHVANLLNHMPRRILAHNTALQTYDRLRVATTT
jgi:IS30 family transposase